MGHDFKDRGLRSATMEPPFWTVLIHSTVSVQQTDSGQEKSIVIATEGFLAQ